MGKCAGCGNEYDKSFVVTRDGTSQTFDSFECAIHVMAPHCAHCGMVIIGHGVEERNTIYCCVHCASAKGLTQLVDRT